MPEKTLTLTVYLAHEAGWRAQLEYLEQGARRMPIIDFRGVPRGAAQ
jgi:hypothetical protein